jgi:hypothetical protein
VFFFHLVFFIKEKKPPALIGKVLPSGIVFTGDVFPLNKAVSVTLFLKISFF